MKPGSRRPRFSFEAGLGGALEARHLVLALAVVGGERPADVAPGDEGVAEGDRVLHRQLGARADGEVGRVHCIAHEHDVVVVPVLVAHGREGAPQRHVGKQLVVSQLGGEELLAVGQRVLLGGLVQPGPPPGFLGAFDDEGRVVRFVLVSVNPEEAVLAFAKDEGESAQRQRAAKPDELVLAPVQIGLEVLLVALSDDAVGAVGGDDQIAIGEPRQFVDLDLVMDLNAQAGTALLQDI
jgi:hypothetical protein